MGILGFLMMQISYLTIWNRSFSQKWLKMAVLKNGRSFFGKLKKYHFLCYQIHKNGYNMVYDNTEIKFHHLKSIA